MLFAFSLPITAKANDQTLSDPNVLINQSPSPKVPAAPLLDAIKAFAERGDIRDYQAFSRIFKIPVKFGPAVLLGVMEDAPLRLHSKGIMRDGNSPILGNIDFLYNVFSQTPADGEQQIYSPHHVKVAELIIGFQGLQNSVCITRRDALRVFGRDDTQHPTTITGYSHKLSGRDGSDIYISFETDFTNTWPQPLDECSTSLSLSQYVLVPAGL